MSSRADILALAAEKGWRDQLLPGTFAHLFSRGTSHVLCAWSIRTGQLTRLQVNGERVTADKHRRAVKALSE